MKQTTQIFSEAKSPTLTLGRYDQVSQCNDKPCMINFGCLSIINQIRTILDFFRRVHASRAPSGRLTNLRNLFGSQVSLRFLFTMNLISLVSFWSVRVEIRVLCPSMFIAGTYVRAIPHHNEIYLNQPHCHFEL